MLAAVCPSASDAAPAGTALTYQGQLKQDGLPYSGTADLILTLYDADTAGTALVAPILMPAVNVVNGMFSVQVDFGSQVFGVEARYLGIQVRTPAGSGTFTPLTPREVIGGAPYALQTLGLFHSASSGNIGIGTTAPAVDLHLHDDFYTALRFSNTGTGTLGIYGAEISLLNDDFRVVSREPANLHLGTNNNFSMTINSTGSVGIGTTTPGFLLHVNGTAGKPGGGSWSVASDGRLKKNVRALAGALERLLALRGVSFEYKEPQKVHELPGERIGMIGQEVERVFPDWIETGSDGYKRLTYRGFEALTVEALRQLRAEKDAQIQSQQQQIADLAVRYQMLEEQNEQLRARLAALEAAIARQAHDSQEAGE